MYPFPHLRLRLLCFVLLCVFSAGAQDTLSLRVMFYNCENLMDTVNDPLTADDDFTPRGSHHWTSFRLWEKLNRLTRVILAAGEGRPPALIGLAEIENDSVLSQWLRNRAMWKMGYRYLITSGIDTRGIDVIDSACWDGRRFASRCPKELVLRATCCMHGDAYPPATPSMLSCATFPAGWAVPVPAVLHDGPPTCDCGP